MRSYGLRLINCWHYIQAYYIISTAMLEYPEFRAAQTVSEAKKTYVSEY